MNSGGMNPSKLFVSECLLLLLLSVLLIRMMCEELEKLRGFIDWCDGCQENYNKPCLDFSVSEVCLCQVYKTYSASQQPYVEEKSILDISL